MIGFQIEVTDDTETDISPFAFPDKIVDELRKGVVDLSQGDLTEKAFLNITGDQPIIQCFQAENAKTTQVLKIALDGKQVEFDDKREPKNGGGSFKFDLSTGSVAFMGAELAGEKKLAAMSVIEREVESLKSKLEKHFSDEDLMKTEPGF